jgi:hypothetical protein
VDDRVYSDSYKSFLKSVARHSFEVLEAICINGTSDIVEIVKKAGYNYNIVYSGISSLRRDDYVYRIGRPSLALYCATERGKIALAIWHGRQHRARQRKWL